MTHSREIEAKYRIEGWDIDVLWECIKALPFITVERTLETCRTKDIYYQAPLGADIIRLRDSWGLDGDGFSKQLKELTVKCKDRGGNFNRLEENVRLYDSQPAHRVLSLLYGEPLLTLNKEERVLWTRDGAVISLAEVLVGSRGTRTLFLEIEAEHEHIVREYMEQFTAEFTLHRELRSLIEIYGPVIH